MCLHLFIKTLNNNHVITDYCSDMGGIVSLIFHFEVNTRNMSMRSLIFPSLVLAGLARLMR